MQKTANAEKLAEAGRKSWITRRENDLKRKRSEAGKKAAITRQANRAARLKEEAKVVKAANRKSTVKAKSSTVKAKSTTAKTKTSKAKRVVAKKAESLPLTKNQQLKLQRSKAAKKSWATRRKNAKK
jgi:hypothetical protein